MKIKHRHPEKVNKPINPIKKKPSFLIQIEALNNNRFIVGFVGNGTSYFIDLTKKKSKNFKLLWASVREVYNIYQAAKAGSDIITATPDNIAKIKLMNKDLEQYSLETVKMFYDDAQKGNIKI